MNGFIRQLRSIVSAGNAESMTDAQLLDCFATQHDEAAFDALVRRHGPMVLAVCRRVLGDAHDADDAFQATFLILIRKASSIGQPERLGNWLYGVAYRTSLDARANRAKRLARERQVGDMPAAEIPEDVIWRDLRPVLDEELNRLPEKYRAPLVCCYLQGKTKEETARQLGCPEGTVSGNLARAKELVRERLARRGLALTGGLLATVLTQNAAPAAVPATLVDSTLRVGMLFATGQGAAAGALSTPIAALTDRVLQGMLLMRIKTAAMVLLAVSLVATGAGVLAYHAIWQERPSQPEPTRRDYAWIDQRVQAWQPTPAERRLDEIGWAGGLLEAQRLAREHGRPVFLFVYGGSMASARCGGGASTVRAGPLSNSKVIEVLNRSFIPVHISTDEYYGEDFPGPGFSKEGSASLEEKQEWKRIYDAAQQAKLNLRGTPIYILSTDGQVADTLRSSPAEKVESFLQFLDRTIEKQQPAGGPPVVPPAPQFTPPAAEPGALVLHLTSRYLKRQNDQVVPFTPIDRGLGVTGDSWRALPSEDHVVFRPAEVRQLLPAGPVRTGTAWDIDPELSARLLTNFYPQTANTDVTRNILVKQELRARVISVEAETARAWVEGTLIMKHYFALKEDDNVVRASVVGFLDFEPRTQRVLSWRMVTDQATYGGGKKDQGQTTYDPPVPFGVAVRSLP